MEIMNLSVLSYNLWISEKQKLERLETLLSIIQMCDPDVMFFQETTMEVFNMLLSTIGSVYQYHTPDCLYGSYGCAIFSKHPLLNKQTHFYESTMGRTLETAIVNLHGTHIVMATSHFESVFDRKKENTVKINQYKKATQVLNEMYQHTHNVIFGGDCNILVSEEKHLFDSNWLDCWEQLGHNENKFTFDHCSNIHLQDRYKGSGRKYRSRFDRICVRTDNLEPVEFDTIVGIDGMVQPSDHHGIKSTFTVNGAD